ncbi:hypothetical protein COCCU_11430 [Corynebacterium occultum]|uniref:Uncharacterized protein n=1 Tax=Corynebacterium occultum TaxID=2675219 RepID=A0A6B8WDV8_9CORY|nr:hypothetical protein COCCU_11430 [Corynebacterium occultum]
MILVGLGGWFLFFSLVEMDFFDWMDANLPIWAVFPIFTLMMGGVFIGVAALAFSALFDAGKWWVQVLLIAAGVGFHQLAQWWFWADRGQPIIFHPGYLLVFLGYAAIFSGVVSLVWGLVRRSPVTRPGPGRRFLVFGRWLRRFWPLLALIALGVGIWVGVSNWWESRPDPVLRSISGQGSAATDLSSHYEGNWDTWEIVCPSEYPQFSPDEMGIMLVGPGDQHELHRYPRDRLDGCTQDVDPGPHPADQHMLTEGTEPAVIVDRLSRTS